MLLSQCRHVQSSQALLIQPWSEQHVDNLKQNQRSALWRTSLISPLVVKANTFLMPSVQ
ncbi:hypothetical protein OIU78_030048 [Salix suchowensis]|nr:hypothetical protein OIU78_030048 [Salix suchowensis]